MLDRQIQIISTDTAGFYSNREIYLHKLNHRIKSERNKLNDELNVICNYLDKKGIDVCDMQEDNIDIDDIDIDDLKDICDRYIELKNIIAMKNKKIRRTKEDLLLLLSNKAAANISSNGKHHIRELRDNDVCDTNIISVFDSYFTRTIGAEPDKLCDDFMVVQVYYFDVIKDLIYYGFVYNGEKYIYFTSSAGQIRTKKTVFVKESIWKKYEKSIMCGLTIDDINAKGGNNPNKHLAYLALANSATDVWEDFDIDKTIVIEDFETDVFGTYDLVDDVDYSIKRVSGEITITHTDGAGMMLPKIGKNRMIRLPWVKGLLGAFDFRKFIEHNRCTNIIKDIYGVEHNIVEEDIEIILTKSQFKMWNHYDSWEQYKEMYKKYGCTAGITNVEEDRIKNATINYQMLQTLTDVNDDEILAIAQPSIDKLNHMCDSVNNIKAEFGITPYNTDKNAFQKSVELYPDLLNDEYVKSQLREIKDSLVKKYRAGKLQVNGKYTFLLPDFYAACQYWFCGIENPDGLLGDNEVFCWLFRKSDKLDCLRSPHLYKEHAIRKNVACYEYGERQERLREWYCTDAIYTSCHDLISKILQFDNDGDKSLVVADKTIIEVAERNMSDIVPLYYNMKKSSPVHLDNESIYNGLNAAFTGGNIGQYSNNISKIWNSDVFRFGTKDDKRDAIDIVKLLCMENNFVIDYAKTLYKPERPKQIKELITNHTKESLPHFFKYAKDKNDGQVLDVNDSFVNRLYSIIPNPRINCRGLGLNGIDCYFMMNNPDIECRVEFTNNGKLVKEKTDPLIVKYCSLNSKHHFALENALRTNKALTSETVKRSQYMRNLRYKMASDEIKYELSQFGYSDEEVCDILVKFLYGIKKSKHKTALWMCYGDYILNNLEKYFKPQSKSVQCIDCGEWFDVGIFDSATCRCAKCNAIHKRELARLRKRKQRENA